MNKDDHIKTELNTEPQMLFFNVMSAVSDVGGGGHVVISWLLAVFKLDGVDASVNLSAPVAAPLLLGLLMLETFASGHNQVPASLLPPGSSSSALPIKGIISESWIHEYAF